MNNPFEIIDARLSNIENLLLDLKHRPLHPGNRSESEYTLTVQEAAAHIKLAVPTVYALVSQGVLPHSKKGKKLYFSKQELNDWIKSGRKKTISEIQKEAIISVGAKSRKG